MTKKLHEFKNIHLDNDIYIIASGKSTEFIDNSFFEKKLTIGINNFFKKLTTTYSIRKEYKTICDIIDIKDTVHFISSGDCGSNNDANKKYIINNLSNNNNLVIFNHDNNNLEVEELPDDDKLIVSWSTITSAIHLAAYMGAKNIILVGHDCGFIDNESNYSGYYDNYNKPEHNFYDDWLPKIENQTIKLKLLLKKKYNCNIYSLNPFINFNLEGHIYSKIKN